MKERVSAWEVGNKKTLSVVPFEQTVHISTWLLSFSIQSEQRDARVLAQETLDVALGVNRVAIEQTLPPVIAGLRAAICAHLRQPRGEIRAFLIPIDPCPRLCNPFTRVPSSHVTSPPYTSSSSSVTHRPALLAAGILRLRRPTPRHRDLVPTVLGAAPIPLSPLDLVSGGDEWGAQQAAAALEGAATLARLLALFCACPALADLHGTAHNASASLPSSFLSLLSSAPDSTPSSCHLPVTWLAGTTTAAQDLVQAVAGVSRATSPAGASPEVALARLSQGLRALFVHFRTVALAALPQSLVGSQAWASAQDLPPPVLVSGGRAGCRLPSQWTSVVTAL